MSASQPTHADAIVRHYETRWRSAGAIIRLDRGRVHELPSDFSVLHLRRGQDMDAYATVSMSQPEEDPGLELHLLTWPARVPEPELVELLTIVAHYHRTGAPLDVGHSVNFGRPYLPGSACTHGLICLPYLDGPTLEWLDAPRVHFLWLLPITAAEVAFKKTHGLDALEKKLEEAGVNYLNPLRASVV